jgi:hypothetical protein
MRLVQGPLATAMTGKADDITTIPYTGGNGYLTYEKWQSLSNGIDIDTSLKAQQNDLFQVLAAGPLTLAPGASDTVAFAVMGAANRAAIKAIADRAALQVPWSCCHGSVGNVDCDPIGETDIADLTRMIDYLYIGHDPLCCQDAAEFDGDPGIDIGDLTGLIDHLYIGRSPMPSCLQK